MIYTMMVMLSTISSYSLMEYFLPVIEHEGNKRGGTMNKNTSSILIIDDEPGIHEILSRLLESEFKICTAYSGTEGLEKLNNINPNLILLDLRMPQMSGITFLRKLRKAGKDIPVIVLTAYGGVNSAVQAIKLGAVDYIEKPFDNRKLKQTIENFLSKRKNIQELPVRQEIIGESSEIKKVWKLVEKYGPTDLPILLYGETGTGKELFARAIHEISKRSQGAFVPLDCSVLPESLVESELFGYEKGAFTGAKENKPGQLEWADGGTLFLDEISNLPMSYQAKLLRVLQEREYVSLGARNTKSLDVRFISASNVVLSKAIQQNSFRNDLYYRISGVVIELPPLRDREGDIELLAYHFIRKYGKKYNKTNLRISDEAIELLLSHHWPGNVRELEHAVLRAVIIADYVIRPEHFIPNIQREIPVSDERISALDNDDSNTLSVHLNFTCDVNKPVDLKQIKKEISSEVEKQIITEVKKRLSLNQTELAEFLRIDPKTLRSKEKKYTL